MRKFPCRKDGEGAGGQTGRENRRLGCSAINCRDIVLALPRGQGAPILTELDVVQAAISGRVAESVEHSEGVEAAEGEAGIDGELSKVGKRESARDGRGRWMPCRTWLKRVDGAEWREGVTGERRDAGRYETG